MEPGSAIPSCPMEKLQSKVVERIDSLKYSISAELLRVESPSAEVQGHGPNEKKILPGKQAVVILAIEQVGNYAVKLRFDDGHDTGIYSWKYLYHLGSQKAEVWNKYLEQLASKGLSRT